jgi:hypothetical protein
VRLDHPPYSDQAFFIRVAVLTDLTLPRDCQTAWTFDLPRRRNERHVTTAPIFATISEMYPMSGESSRISGGRS